MKRIAVIGGGAAGFFFAINLKEMAPDAHVTIFEKGKRVLRKVEISGGGRCNCTNTFAHVKDLSAVYPRGHRLMKRLFNVFNQHDAMQWFERHGVKLTIQPDDCVFPASQDAHTIIDCFLRLARQHDINIVCNSKISSLDELDEFDDVLVTTGGAAQPKSLEWLQREGIETQPSLPSLYTLKIDDNALHELMGTVANSVTAFIPGTGIKSEDTLLITHWGMSGPAILKLSSHAAPLLHSRNFQSPLGVNWCNLPDMEVMRLLKETTAQNPKKSIASFSPINIPQRLWRYLVGKTLDDSDRRWCDIGKKDLSRLVNTLTNDHYQVTGRGTHKDEFVTCGGIALSAVHPNTLESRVRPHLYFAGEVLDIDGITGGFNFQAAWTTAYVVAKHLASE